MRLSLDMSVSREEFLRLLPSAVGPHAFEADGLVCGNQEQGHWTIRLVPMADRPMGSVSLTRHRVDITLQGFSAGEAEGFLARFHRGFLRGGG